MCRSSRRLSRPRPLAVFRREPHGQLARVEVLLDVQPLSDRVRVPDARAEGEFAEGHLPGALNIPTDNFYDYDVDGLVPIDAAVIVYCRSVTCDLSDRLAQELRLMGYQNVVVYRGGWDEWSEAGFPLD